VLLQHTVVAVQPLGSQDVGLDQGMERLQPQASGGAANGSSRW
jgi:hypothetical protein